MQLRVLLPTSVLIDVAVSKVAAEGQHGSFTLLPRHVDVVVALVPGLLTWEQDGTEMYGAVDGGLLVKRGADVTISTPRAAIGPGLGALRLTIEKEFQTIDDRERAARRAMARLEADFIQRFLDLEERTRA